jgi:hypothetical protein
MKLKNGNTLVLLVGSLLIIVLAFIMLNRGSSPTSASATATPQGGGALFEGVSLIDVQSFTIRDNLNATETRITKAEDGAWVLADSDQRLVQTTVDASVGDLLTLRAETRFSADDLVQYGLSEAAFSLSISTTSAEYQLSLGKKNPAGTRYYALFSGDAPQTVSLLTNPSVIDRLTPYASTPPISLPTPTPGVDISQAGALFNDFSDARILRLSVEDTQADLRYVQTRLSDGTWDVAPESSAFSAGASVDQTLARVAVQELGFISSLDVVDGADYSRLGLEAPRYRFAAERDDGFAYEVHVGDLDPTGTRYYALVNEDSTVVILNKQDVEDLTILLEIAPYEVSAEATPEVTVEATAEATSAP